MARLYIFIQFLSILCFSGLIQQASGLSRPSTMVLENNGFKNVVIAIHESVAEDKALIDTLKDEMTKASKILHKATKQRAYFEEIKILLPSTWSADSSYRNPTTENLAFADVIITDPIRGKRSLPQTRSYDGCGKQGVHVLLTKEFLTVPREEPFFGDPAKYFIHAFAQFRWGVFQEYAEEGENVFYMSPSTGQPEAIRCTFGIRGLVQKNDSAHTICYSKLLAERAHVVASVDEETGLYHPDCQWRPYPAHQRTKASIMDHQFIAELETFCGDDSNDLMTIHNYEAPSKHNRLCSHRSTWSVITETDDFKGGKNPTRAMSDDQLKPTFIILRSTSRRRRSAVLVDPTLMKQMTIRRALSHLHLESSFLGAEVTVSQNTGTMLKDKNTTDPQNHSYFYDETNFAHLLTETINNLRHTGKDTETHLVIITNNFTANVKRALEQGENHTLKVSLISNSTSDGINEKKDNYKVLPAGVTLGHTLLDRLRHALLIEQTEAIIVIQKELQLWDTTPVTGKFDVDSTLGRRALFSFHFEGDVAQVDLRSPSGKVYGLAAHICAVDNISKMIIFHFDLIEVGSWNFTIRQTSKTVQKVHVSAISMNNYVDDPIIVRKSIKFVDKTNSSLVLHVDVTHGSFPLLGLNVTAKIELPNGRETKITLHDNGAGADILKNDGVYSRVYLAPKINGLYHVTLDISGMSGSVFRKETFSIVTNDKVKNIVTKRPLEESIHRQIYGSTVYIEHTENNVSNDVLAPSRITDLEAIKYIQFRKSIVLKWTAPGDDYDHGKPACYDLFVGCGIKDVRLFLQYISTGIYAGQGYVKRETVTASAEGTKDEIFTWNVKNTSMIHVFAVRAIDKSGNKGEISNIATVAT